MEYDGNRIAVYNDKNQPVECTIISKFMNETTGKSYLVYTDDSRNELGKKNMFVVSYRPDLPDEDTLKPIETEEEWISITEFLDELRKLVDEKGLDL